MTLSYTLTPYNTISNVVLPNKLKRIKLQNTSNFFSPEEITKKPK